MPETVNQLVSLVRNRFPNISKEKILDGVIQLQYEGKIRLSARQPPNMNLTSYVRTGRAAWFWATLACTLASVAAIFLIRSEAGPFVIVRSALGVLFVLWFPGYTLVKTLFPTFARSKEKADKNLDVVERIALSLGMSLAFFPIVGLLLNYLPGGITLGPIVIALAVPTLVFATTALLRENRNRNKQEQSEAEHQP